MLYQSALGSLVVVWRYLKQGVRAELFSGSGKSDAVGGIVRAGSCNYRNSVSDLLNGVADALKVLLVRHGGSLAGGAAYYESVCAVGYLELDELAELIVIDGAVGVHRGDDGGAYAGKYSLFHGLSFHGDISPGSPLQQAAQPFQQLRLRRLSVCCEKGTRTCNRTLYQGAVCRRIQPYRPQGCGAA